MEYTYYINGIQYDDEEEFLQEMADQGATFRDFVDVNDGYIFVGNNCDMFWIEFMED
jgi:hypothetical protein